MILITKFLALPRQGMSRAWLPARCGVALPRAQEFRDFAVANQIALARRDSLSRIGVVIRNEGRDLVDAALPAEESPFPAAAP